MTVREMLLCAGFSLALPLGQLMFKGAANHNAQLTGPFLYRALTNLPLWVALAWYGATAIFWFYILTRVPLSSAYAFSILGSGLVPLLAWLVYREPLTWHFAAGYALMLAGFMVIMRGHAAP